MTKFKFLTILMLVTCSCGKKSELAYYKDSSYPFLIGYLPQKMTVRPLSEDKDTHWVKVKADLSKELPDDPIAVEVPLGLYDVIIHKNLDSFAEIYQGSSTGNEETILNGIPAIASKDEGGRIFNYILLVPRTYVQVWLFGVNSRQWNPTDISQQLSDRREQLTYEMIKHFKWNQKIDTNSEEFNAWKKHIWEILKTPRKKIKTQ